MEIINRYLTPVESKALKLLSEEKNYEVIKRECGVSTIELCAFLATLRKKTGISQLKNGQMVRDYIKAYAHSVTLKLSPQQNETLSRLVGKRHSELPLGAIAGVMGLTMNQFEPLLESAFHAAGIFATDRKEQRNQTRVYFASTCSPNADGLSSSEKNVLRLYSSEHEYSIPAIAEELSIRETWVLECIKRGCAKLGTVAYGRGVQRKLTAIALARIDREKTPENLMDDPAF